MKFKTFLLISLSFTLMQSVYCIEIQQWALIEQNNSKLEFLKKKEKSDFKAGEILYLLLEVQKASINSCRGSVRWYLEFYINGKLNTRLKPEWAETCQDQESWGFWRVFQWKIPKISGNYQIILNIHDLIKDQKLQKILYFRVGE